MENFEGKLMRPASSAVESIKVQLKISPDLEVHRSQAIAQIDH